MEKKIGIEICGHQCSKLRGYDCYACRLYDEKNKKEQVGGCSNNKKEVKND
jgi:hypothetical protein